MLQLIYSFCLIHHVNGSIELCCESLLTAIIDIYNQGITNFKLINAIIVFVVIMRI
jgi:hypothetical protein